MTEPFRDARAFTAALADLAEKSRQAILAMRDDRERSDHLEKLVAESDMVFGVWPEPGEVDGVGIQIVKGDELIPPLVGFETNEEVRIAAIACTARDVAIAARDVWNNPAARDESGEAANTAAEKLSASEAERSRWASLRRSAPA